MFFFILKILSIIIVSALLFYIYAVRRNAYWRKRGIPGPIPAPIKGNLDLMHGPNPGVFQLRKWTKEFGRVFGIQMGWYNVLVTSDPAIAHEVLVEKYELFRSRLILPVEGDLDTSPNVNMFTAKGKRWKRLRMIANPAFTVSAFKRVMPIMEDSIKACVNFLEREFNGNPNGVRSLDIFPFCNELTLDVIMRVAFGRPECQQFRCPEFTKLTRDTFASFGNNPFDYCMWQFPWLAHRVIGPLHKLSGKDMFDMVCRKFVQTVSERKQQRENESASGVERTRHADFIDMFLDRESNREEIEENAEAAETANGKEGGGGGHFQVKTVQKKITVHEILHTCVLFLLAGFDTTANSLALTCHRLALHPEVQAQMVEEMETICGLEENGEPLAYEQMNQLKYMEAVIKETLRLCPFASPVITRVCEQTTTLGDGKIPIEKGTAVFFDMFSLHRDKGVWGEDAEEFRPERWLEPDVPVNAFYAFGGGPRICIGMRFALLEVKMSLCHLLRKFRLQCSEQTEKNTEALKFTGQVVLNPKSVTVQLVPRSSQHQQQ